MIIFYLFAVFGFTYWGGRCFIYARQIRYLSDHAVSQGVPKAAPKVSILVPFCDEEGSIVKAAKKLALLEYPNLEILYLNDRSTDGGGEALETYLASKSKKLETSYKEHCFHIKELPNGWLGKLHAIDFGLKQAQGKWVLLMDADVMLEPSVLQKAVDHCESDNLDHLALIAEFGSPGFWTTSLQAAFFSLVPLAFLPAQVRSPKSNVYAGVGAFQLIRRSFLQKVGGMKWLALEVIDDIGLGKLVKANHGKSELMSGRGLAKLHWYGSIPEMIRGTEKNLFAAMRYSLWRMILQVTFSLGLAFYFVWSLYTCPPSLLVFGLGMLSLLFFFIGLHRYYRVWNFNAFHALTIFFMVPILFWMLVRNSVLAWRKGGISWRGTFYSIDTLIENQRVFLGTDFVFGYPKAAVTDKESPEVRPLS